MGGSMATLAGMFGGFGQAQDLAQRRMYLPSLKTLEVPIHLGKVVVRPWVPVLRRDELRAMVYPVAPYSLLRKHFRAYQRELPLLKREEGETVQDYERRERERELTETQVIAHWMEHWWLGIMVWTPHMRSEDIPYRLQEIPQAGTSVKTSRKVPLYAEAPKYIGVSRAGVLQGIVDRALARHPMLPREAVMLPNPDNRHVVYIFHGQAALMYAILAELQDAGYALHFPPHMHEWTVSLLKGQVPSNREVAQAIPRIYALAPLVKSPVAAQRFRREDFNRALGMFNIPQGITAEQLSRIAIEALYRERVELLNWKKNLLVGKLRRPSMVMNMDQKAWFERRKQRLREAYLILTLVASGHGTVIG